MPFFNNRRKLLYLLGISLVLYFIPIPFPSFFALADLKRIMVYFVLGCVLCEYSEIREKSHINVFVVLGFYIIVYILGKQLDFAVFTPVLKFALALCGIYVVANFAQALEQRTIKIRKILLNIAACTYTIYLFHTTFMGFAKAVILKLGFQLVDPNNFFVFISMALIVILAGVVAPIILHKKVVRYSRFFSYLIGAKFIGTKEKRIKEGCLES